MSVEGDGKGGKQAKHYTPIIKYRKQVSIAMLLNFLYTSLPAEKKKEITNKNYQIVWRLLLLTKILILL